jgi:hypothetical protein
MGCANPINRSPPFIEKRRWLHPNPNRQLPSQTNKNQQQNDKRMKLHLYTVGLISGASAFTTAPTHRAPRQLVSTTQRFSTAEDVKAATVFDQEQFIATSKEMRLQHLEEQAMYALKIAVENYGNAVRFV